MVKKNAWEDKILSVLMVKKNAWREYLEGVFGGSIWRVFWAGGGSAKCARQPELPRFITKSHNNDTRSVDELARDKAGEDNDVEEDKQQSGGDYSEDEEGDNEEVQDESEESD
ncbi:hypothetical protein Tco_1540262 [Tanacetum coccineum]